MRGDASALDGSRVKACGLEAAQAAHCVERVERDGRPGPRALRLGDRRAVTFAAVCEAGLRAAVDARPVPEPPLVTAATERRPDRALGAC